MNQDTVKNTFESIARDGIPDDLNLWPQIAERIKERNTIMKTLQAKPIVIVLLLILVLILLTGVAYAINNLLGYIPNIGVVDQNSPLRVLAEPVEITRDGVTVRIEQVVADQQRTVIVYKTEGLSVQAANSKGEGGPFGSPHLLVLSDGSILEEATLPLGNGDSEPIIQNLHTQGGWPNYVWRLVYPAIPPNINDLTLLIPILQTMPAGAAPENWQISFRLKPAPANLTVMPLIQVDSTAVAPTTGVSQPSGEETSQLSSIVSSKGFTFKLDNVIELNDGFVLSGDLTWQDSAFYTVKGNVIGFEKPRLLDENGTEIAIEEVPVENYGTDTSRNWSYRTNTKSFSGPLTLVFNSIEPILYPNPIDFELDLGNNPQVNQKWEIQRDFMFQGKTLRLLSAELIQLEGDPCWKYSLRFHFKSDDPHLTAGIQDVVPPTPLQKVCGGGGGGPLADPEVFMASDNYPNIPTGLHHFTVVPTIDIVVSGPWQLVWNPPVSTNPTQTPPASACLTRENWNKLKDLTQALPEGLTGKVVFTIQNTMHIYDLAGNELQSVSGGNWPSLSHTGSSLAYSAVDNTLHIVNLESGENIPTIAGGYHPIWSPDDQRLLLLNAFGVFVINKEGSAQEKIDAGEAQIFSAVGWIDEQTVVYGALGGEGFLLKKYNLQTGETVPLFTIQNKAGYGAISPDGQWIVFADKVFGADNWGIFIAKLDGSDKRMIVSPDVPTAFISLWSPDGKWLLVNTTDSNWESIPFLINPSDCQSIPLRQFRQMIENW